ncbi:DHHC zinc finger protein [Diaporthe helianthi]|uniref:Palmitoyltransferase n=1 Tax=Diaporthe helianthi TaxID=158607 RepID=A0A2P5I407_DIAHE|nr:DHHC zinc finger protein [Diaporthe helianthi]
MSSSSPAAAAAAAEFKLFPRPEARSHNAANRWTTRIIPVFLLAVIGFACWALTKPICSESISCRAAGRTAQNYPEKADTSRRTHLVDFFIARNQLGSAVALLVLHYIFLILMLVCYARTLHTVTFNPAVVPLEPKLGLESFYTRDFYTCRSDGLPIWCSDCQNWKPDRAHHSGDIQRCVKKMDHYCPWAGGMIGETAFKFFIQFVTYTACYCIICLSAGAYVTRMLANEGSVLSVPAIILIAFSAFFGLFSFTMAAMSHGFALSNITNIENLSRRTKVHQLAIRIPLNQTPNSDNSAMPNEYETITFPLANPNFDGNQFIYENQNEANGANGANATSQRAPEHKFAIVKTEVGENPWDTGSYYQNWKSVMGDKGLFDWLLPLRLSPCCHYDGQYPMGPVVDRLREKLKK